VSLLNVRASDELTLRQRVRRLDANKNLRFCNSSLKMTIVSGLRIIDSNAQTGITWWNWTV
jgi:hypothetical protein